MQTIIEDAREMTMSMPNMTYGLKYFDLYLSIPFSRVTIGKMNHAEYNNQSYYIQRAFASISGWSLTEISSILSDSL